MGSFMDMYNAIFGHMLHSWHNDEQDSGESPTVTYYHVRKPVQQGGSRVVKVYYAPSDTCADERAVHVVHVLHAANNNNNQPIKRPSQQQQQQQQQPAAAAAGGVLRVVCTSETSLVITEVVLPPDQEIPALFKCPISQKIMREPVMTSDGHTYDKENICQWFCEHNGKSPLVDIPLLPIAFRNAKILGMILNWIRDVGGKATTKEVKNSL
jgi:hypothetical protein